MGCSHVANVTFNMCCSHRLSVMHTSPSVLGARMTLVQLHFVQARGLAVLQLLVHGAALT
jgi:hypothetical protein